LALAAVRDPQDLWRRFLLGVELRDSGRRLSARRTFTGYLERGSDPVCRAMCHDFLGDISVSRGEFDVALDHWGKSFSTCARRSPLLRMANFYRDRKDYVRAASYAAAALEVPWDDSHGGDRGQYTWEPHSILYWAKGWLGDIPGAQFHVTKCLEYLPKYEPFLRDRKFYF